MPTSQYHQSSRCAGRRSILSLRDVGDIGGLAIAVRDPGQLIAASYVKDVHPDRGVAVQLPPGSC